MKEPKHNPTHEPHGTGHKSKSDVMAFADYVRENPLQSALFAGVIAIAAVVALIYTSSQAANRREALGQYAEALATEDPALRAAELEPVAAGNSEAADDALYMMGEAAYEARDYGKAKEAFTRLRAEYPKSEHVPVAVEGLGYVAENEGNYEDALAIYNEILDKWPTSLAGLRQHFNIGRCYGGLDDYAAAKEAYEAQIDAFPGSVISARAEGALEELQKAHPDLFPAEEEAAEAEGEPATETTPEPAEATEPVAETEAEAQPETEAAPELGEVPEPQAAPEAETQPEPEAAPAEPAEAPGAEETPAEPAPAPEAEQAPDTETAPAAAE